METTDKLNAGRDTNRDINQIAKDTRTDLHSAIDKAAERAQPMADRLATGAHNTVDKMAETADTMSTKFGERSKQLGDAAQRFAETGRTTVRSSPAMSVLIAMAAGYGLSKLLSSRK